MASKPRYSKGPILSRKTRLITQCRSDAPETATLPRNAHAEASIESDIYNLPRFPTCTSSGALRAVPPPANSISASVLGIVLNGTPPPRHPTNLLVDPRLSGSGHDASASTSYPAWGRNGLCPNAGNISPLHGYRRVNSLVEAAPRHWPERELVVPNKGAVLHSVYHQLFPCEDQSLAASLTGQLHSLTHSQPLVLLPKSPKTPTTCYPTLRQPLSPTSSYWPPLLWSQPMQMASRVPMA